jgi:hypothetical protein
VVANGAHQPQALLQAHGGGFRPALFAVRLAQVEQDLSLPAVPAQLAKFRQALFEPGDGVLEPTLPPVNPAEARQALQLPKPVAGLPERCQALL